jgi:hypothetical protein
MNFARALAMLPLLLVACAASPRGPGLPRGAVEIEGETHRACRCMLVHVTTSASTTRAIDRAALHEAMAKDETLCAYELLADDPEVAHQATSELAPFLLQAQGAPVVLAIRHGESEVHVVAPISGSEGDDALLRAACGSPAS